VLPCGGVGGGALQPVGDILAVGKKF